MSEYIDKNWLGGDLSGYTTPGWYFWDEAQADCYGPYSTKEECETASEAYFKQL